MCSRADSTTIMFATEPMMVRFPANVVASASTFHIKFGSAKRAIHFLATSTNGTFEKIFDPAMENHVKFQACGVRENFKTRSAAQSKKCARYRYADTSIMASSSTIVS